MHKKIITARVGAKFNPRSSWMGNYVGGLQPDLWYIRVDELIETLLSYKRDYPEYENLRINRQEEYGDTIHVLLGDRLETDEEYEWRLATEVRIKEEQQARERKEYERLKSKFSGD
jgi:hypothetical protein